MDLPSSARALQQKDVLLERIEQITSWLKENGREYCVDQSRLEYTTRSAYWNCGYLKALKDVLALLSDETDLLL
jgi:hypothetical protein